MKHLLFGEPKDTEDAARRQEYLDYMLWVDHVVASMELEMFPLKGCSPEAQRLHAFRERAAQQ